MSSDVDKTVFAVVGATPAILRAFFADLPEPVRIAAVDDGWSPRHVLAHLLDTEDVIVGRMQRIVEEERPFIRSIDAQARLQQPGYLDRDVDALLREFETRRTEGIAWLRAMSPAQLARLGEHDEAGETSAAGPRASVGLPRSHALEAGCEHGADAAGAGHGQHAPLLLWRLTVWLLR